MHGFTALRQGTVAGTQEGLRTGDVTKGVKTGAEVAAGSAALSGVAEVLPDVIDAVKELRTTLRSTTRGYLRPQATLQQGIRSVMNTVAKENEIAPSEAKAIRGVIEETGDKVYAKSKAQYAELDAATGGRFQRFEDRLKNIRLKLNELTGTEEDVSKEAKLLKAQRETEEAQEAAFEEAKAAGVDPKLVDEARENWKRAQALYDVDSQLKMATSGARPGRQGLAETVDPKKIHARLNKLYDSGRLQEALGEDNAHALLDHAGLAELRNSRIKTAETVGKVAGITGGSYEAAKSILGKNEH